MQRLGVLDGPVPDHPVQAVLGHQVDFASEQLLQVRLGREERQSLRKAVGMSGWQSPVAGMREPDLHTARAAYDAIAPVYADQFKDTLDDRPTERALLAAFAEVIHRGSAG